MAKQDRYRFKLAGYHYYGDDWQKVDNKDDYGYVYVNVFTRFD